MFWKLALLVAALGLTACLLLAIRTLRIQAAHELAAARLRIIDADARLCLLRARIAEHVCPERVARATAALGPLRPIPPRPDLSPVGSPLDPAGEPLPPERPEASPTAVADGSSREPAR